MNRYFRIIKKFPGTLRLTDMIIFNGKQMNVLNFKDNQVNGGYSSSVIFNLTVQDLENKEYFEESVGISKDKYVLFKGDKVYIEENDLCLTLVSTTVNYNKYYYKKENVPVISNVKTWDDLKILSGYYISTDSEVLEVYNYDIYNHNKNVCFTKKQALSNLAFAQLSQIIAETNGDWIADYDDNKIKYTINRFKNQITKCNSHIYYFPLCFKTEELRDFSFINHSDLWKQYYQL